MDYSEFIRNKSQYATESGFAPKWMPTFLFDFQSYIVDWEVRKGRGAIFADCGLGKTPMQLSWAEIIRRHTNKPILILTPLAVGVQTVAEAAKFGIEARRCPDGKLRATDNIVVANYERIHMFDPNDFGGIVADESSCCKAFNGKRRAQVTEFMRTLPFRLLCTATSAPNDYTELGTSSEMLGELGHIDMLNRFFKNDQNTSDTKLLTRKPINQGGPVSAGWRFKGHSEQHFYRWVCSWARAGCKPSDFGEFDDARFALPPLEICEHIVETTTLAEGMLFAMPATNMREERDERRRTIQERCEKAAELVYGTGEPAVVWCHLNAEGDLLEELIPECKQVAGATSEEAREEIYTAFSNGQLRVLPIKARIGAWGMNWQHCRHVVTFASHSFEQYYQGVRRCWRFGQTRPVKVDLIATEGELGAKINMLRKSDAADKMFTELTRHMHDAELASRSETYSVPVEVPSWV